MDGGRRRGLRLRVTGLIQICLFLGKLRLITLNNMAGSKWRERCVFNSLDSRRAGGEGGPARLLEDTVGQGWMGTHTHTLVSLYLLKRTLH